MSPKDQFYFTILSNLSLTIQIPKANLINRLDDKSIQDVRLQRIYFENAMDYTSKYLYQNQLLKVINEYPNDPHLLRFWARFLSKINQFKLAELNYQKALNLFEKNDNPEMIIEGIFSLKYLDLVDRILDYLNKIDYVHN